VNQPKRKKAALPIKCFRGHKVRLQLKIKHKYMKKLLFGLIATVFFGNNSFAQSKGLDYFLQMDPVKTAQIHNNVLGDIQKLQKDNPKLSIKDAFLKIDLALSTEDRIKIYDYISLNKDATKNFEIVLTNLKTDRAREIYTNINNAISKNTDYRALIKVIDAEELKANNELKDFDLKVVQLFAETSKASATYWFNSPDTASANPTEKANWIKKDGNGIAQASVGWAIGAAFCGGGPLSYAIACGAGGALASIWP
jgi:hypothetical protein